jgi:hypothetical protein
MKSLVISLKELLKALEIALKIFKNAKKILMEDPPKNLIQVMMVIFLLHKAHQWIYKMHQKEDVPKEEGIFIEPL